MKDPRYALVRACFESMEEIFPAGDFKNKQPLKQAASEVKLPQMPQMPQSFSRVFRDLPLSDDL